QSSLVEAVSDQSPQHSLEDLCQTLAVLSHDESALNVVRDFSQRFPNTSARLNAFNAPGGLVIAPITVEQASSAGFDGPDDHFALLQGDLVSSESAYFMGERVCAGPKYVVLNSSCDLVPGRGEYALLLRVSPVRAGKQDSKAKLNLFLQYKKADTMYLPAFQADDPDVLCNAVHFDGACQIRSDDLALANRLASLSVVG